MHLRSPRIHPSFRWPRRDVEGDTGRFSSGYELWVRARERVSPSGTESIAGARTQIRGALNVFSLRNARFSDCFAIFHTCIKKKIITQISPFIVSTVCQIDVKYLYIHESSIVRCKNYNIHNVLKLCIKLYRFARFVEKRREKDIVAPQHFCGTCACLTSSSSPVIPLFTRYPAFIPLFAFVCPFSVYVITKSRSFILCFLVPPTFLESSITTFLIRCHD